MRVWLFALGFCLLMPGVSRGDVYSIDKLPRNDWAEAAIQQLTLWGARPFLAVTWASRVQGFSLHAREPMPRTRYEMAVTIASAIDKFGYNPASTNSIDGLKVRDVLAALVYEYRDELMPLYLNDPLSSDTAVFEAYCRDKAAHKNLTPSQWYERFQQHPWTIEHENRDLPPIMRHAEDHIFDEVPPNHWSLGAARLLVRGELGPTISGNGAFAKSVTRRDMAFLIAHSMEKLAKASYKKAFGENADYLSCYDALVALTFEYRDDVVLLIMERRRAAGGLELKTNAEKIQQFTFINYLIDKEKYKRLSSTDWYTHFQSRLWEGFSFNRWDNDQPTVYPLPAAFVTPVNSAAN